MNVKNGIQDVFEEILEHSIEVYVSEPCAIST